MRMSRTVLSTVCGTMGTGFGARGETVNLAETGEGRGRGDLGARGETAILAETGEGRGARGETAILAEIGEGKMGVLGVGKMGVLGEGRMGALGEGRMGVLREEEEESELLHGDGLWTPLCDAFPIGGDAVEVFGRLGFRLLDRFLFAFAAATCIS